MLTGPKLGQALARAIKLKGVTQKAVAAEFGVKPPSVSDWISRGVIAKQHIDHMVEYFSDVVQPTHWGLSYGMMTLFNVTDQAGAARMRAGESRPTALPPTSKDEMRAQLLRDFERMNSANRETLLKVADSLASGDRPSKRRAG